MISLETILNEFSKFLFCYWAEGREEEKKLEFKDLITDDLENKHYVVFNNIAGRMRQAIVNNLNRFPAHIKLSNAIGKVITEDHVTAVIDRFLCTDEFKSLLAQATKETADIVDVRDRMATINRIVCTTMSAIDIISTDTETEWEMPDVVKAEFKSKYDMMQLALTSCIVKEFSYLLEPRG